MSIEQRLRSGLSANVEHLSPDLDRELADLLRRTRQRRTRRVGVWVVAATAAVAAAIVWLPGVADNIRTGDDTNTATDPTPTTVAPMPVPTDYTLLLEPGEYAVPIEGRDGLQAVVDIRGGFHFESPWPVFLEKQDARADGTGHPGVGIWNGEALRVDNSFCVSDSESAYEDPGPTVADLAGFLADQPGLRGSDPVPTSVDGYQGLYVELLVPADASKCGRGVLWLMNGGRPHDFLFPGFTERLWILDVAGKRVVIDAFHRSEASATEVAELTRIVMSTAFTGSK